MTIDHNLASFVTHPQFQIIISVSIDMMGDSDKMSSILRHRASAPPPYQVLSNEGSGPNPTQFRVHVSVNSEVFLVGVPNPRAKVSWLAKNVAERYFRETGLKVSLRIGSAREAAPSCQMMTSSVLLSATETSSAPT